MKNLHFAIEIQRFARGMLTRKAINKGRVSLDTLETDPLELIIGAAGSPFEGARMRARLRGVARSLNADTISSDERIGHDVMGKMKLYGYQRYTSSGQLWYTAFNLYGALHVNRLESTTIKKKYGWHGSPSGHNIYIVMRQAFSAAKWFIENHGGWNAHEKRIERQKENAARAEYHTKKKSLQYMLCSMQNTGKLRRPGQPRLYANQ